MKAFFHLLGCEFRLHLRHASRNAGLILFFLLIIVLLPFAIGPEPDLLRRLAPGLIWLAALLMSLLALDDLFIADARDGTLDLMQLSTLPLPLIIAGKMLAQIAIILLAILVMLPPAAFMLGMEWTILPVLAGTFILGLPVLFLLGGVMGAITVGLRRHPALLTLLLTPLYIPALIFAVSACDAAVLRQSIWPVFCLLGAMLALLIPTAPILIAAILRQDQS